MLENIRLILNLIDSSYDGLISLYISKVEAMIMDYCNLKQLSPGLIGFVEDKVISIVKPTITGGTQNTGEIKAITRGDTKIEYNVGEAVQTSVGATLTDTDKEFLNQYRKARCF